MNFELNENGGWIILNGTSIPNSTSIPNFSEIGYWCEIGNGCTIGDGCTWLGVKMLSWLTMANVDGDGYQVKLVKHADGVMVEAGCFVGTDDEFITAVEAKGFMKYSKAVSAMAEIV